VAFALALDRPGVQEASEAAGRPVTAAEFPWTTRRA
jgi:hypothetical protein